MSYYIGGPVALVLWAAEVKMCFLVLIDPMTYLICKLGHDPSLSDLPMWVVLVPSFVDLGLVTKRENGRTHARTHAPTHAR